jgi:8-oxo-dGTP pyrophosphatase MutT (NUDIX family)
VIVPIIARASPSILFVERARHLRRHPGQIGFPGGITDPGDARDPVRTALRELAEELGVGAERVAVIGRLGDVEQILYRFIVTPIVGMVEPETSFSIDGEEIVGVFMVPLASILATGAIYEDAEKSAARGRTMYAFDYQGLHIWGLTARILKSFVEAWLAPESTLRSAASNHRSGG